MGGKTLAGNVKSGRSVHSQSHGGTITTEPTRRDPRLLLSACYVTFSPPTRMNCFPFRRSAPVVATAPSRKRFAGLPAAILAEILDSLPFAIEFIASSGDVCSNRPDPALGAPGYRAQLSDGNELRCWRCNETGTAFFDDGDTARTRTHVIFRMPSSSDEHQAILLPSADDSGTKRGRAYGGASEPDELGVPQRSFRLPTDVDLFVSSLETLPVQAWAVRISTGLEAITGHSNSKYTEFRGTSVAPLLTHQWREGIFLDDVAPSREAWARAVSAGTAYSNVCRVRRASDGTYVWLREEGRPFRDASGALTAYGFIAYVGVEAQTLTA